VIHGAINSKSESDIFLCKFSIKVKKREIAFKELVLFPTSSAQSNVLFFLSGLVN